MANRYMAIILAGFGCVFNHQFLVNTDHIHQIPFLLGSVLPLELVFPQSLYLYVLGMTRPNAIDRKTWLHFLPTVFGLFLLLPFFMLDHEQKLLVVQSNYILWPGERATSVSLFIGISAVLFTVYLVFSFKLLFAHTRNITHFFSYREDITLSWLRNFLLVMVAFWVMLVFFYYFFFSAGVDAAAQNERVFLVMYLYGLGAIPYLGTMSLLQRRIYSQKTSIEDIAPVEIQESETLSETGPNTAERKYKHSALNSEMSARIVNRLEEVMEDEKPYLNSNLTLLDLAKTVSTTPNYLSQVINEQLQMNFFDYVNSYRLEKAKELLIDPLPHTPTILDVAMESAFNSKSAFYNAFRKKMGITPAEFKKSHSP